MPKTQESPALSLKDFLERVPPGKMATVETLMFESLTGYGTKTYQLNLPRALELHCDTCSGIRLFDSDDKIYLAQGALNLNIVVFKCRNCLKSVKAYALWTPWDSGEVSGRILKIGELPQFGPPTPARVMSLIGPEKEYYLKGRRSEDQGLGIAAFAYYRRVVENQKARIFDNIIRVAQTISAPKEVIDDLSAAKNETQFTKAVDAIKTGIPRVLSVHGHNPLTLLHSALSEGLHADTDEQCLELATSIRVVLSELADRLGNALKDHAELKTAVSRLMAKKPKPEGSA